jgi:anti-sigma B factor antagonist
MSNFSVSFRPHGAAADAGADGGAVCVLDLTGELDAHTATEFEAALQKCLDEGHTRLVVSGRDLQYISSAGLGVFMAFVEPVREAGGDIKIAALQPRVFNVFDLLGFPLLFDIVDTEEAAVARFAEGPPSAA